MHTEQQRQHAEELRRESRALREYSDQLRLSLPQLLRQTEDLRKQLHIRMAKAFEKYVHTSRLSSGEAYHEPFTGITMTRVELLEWL
jgi:hypothetical protein